VKPASVVRVAPEGAPISSRDAGRRAFVIAGLGIALLLLLMVATVPVTSARFTWAGRAVMEHQADLLLAGITALLVTAVVFFLTQGA
jgi:uncharacterized integral membrane protein